MTYLPQSLIKQFRERNKPKTGVCPITKQKTNDWVLDHDHQTGMVRGVISRVGNSLLGKLENFLKTRCSTSPDKYPSILRAMALYLERENLDVLHPVGFRQLYKRFAVKKKSEQIKILLDIGFDMDCIMRCDNAKDRTELYKQSIKNDTN
jgi:hypothetical protein|tara:strand:+ start:91 stop:540 length:450 start_codon:yes stop_codon:yes gene_type:complete